MVLLESLGVKWAALAAGFFGAMISLRFIEGLGTWSRMGTVVGGTVTAAYCSPLAIELLSLSSKLEGAIAFLLGLFGMSIAGAAIKAIPEWVEAARQKWAGK